MVTYSAQRCFIRDYCLQTKKSALFYKNIVEERLKREGGAERNAWSVLGDVSNTLPSYCF